MRPRQPASATEPHPGRARGGATLRRVAIGATFLLLVAGGALAADRELSWASLTVAQQQALAPLKRDWGTIDANRRQKWLEVAARFRSMPPDEQERVQQRMEAWAAMSPNERARARVQFQEARRLTPEERQERWEAYQALSPEERQRLAQAARPSARRPGTANGGAPAPEAATAKSNVVTTSVAPRPRAVAPTVVQARPGASTTSIAAPASPPLHHQAGLPKIVATPGFVDPATLLPQRGPQGAAAQPAAARSDTPPRQ